MLWQIAGRENMVKKRIIYAVLTVFIICQSCIMTQFFSKGEDGVDYIIVLGAQMRDWGPSVVFKYRLDVAIEYLNNNPDTF